MPTRVELDILTGHVERDRSRVVALHKQIREVRGQPTYITTSDITGSPAAGKQQAERRRDIQRGLETLARDLFFARVEARVTNRHSTDEPCCLLMTKAREVGMVADEDGQWSVVPWTNPLSCLVDRLPGTEEQFPVPKRPPVKYVVDAVGRFDTVAPKLSGIQYKLDSGEYFLTSEDDVAQPGLVVAETPPPIKYEAADVIGLGDIIATADGWQRAAMHLPFGSNILIEGPPGSGKTSIGLMRVACLLDQQWESLGLDRHRDRPFHEPSTMRVLVFNEEMVEYLRTLVQSTGVQGARVQTTRSFTLEICRATKTLSGRLASDKRSVVALKSQRRALDAYWAGFVAHVRFTAESELASLQSDLSASGHDASTAYRIVEQWIDRITTFGKDQATKPQSINIADQLARWRSDLETTVPEIQKLPPMPSRGVSRQQAERMLTDRERVQVANDAARERRLAVDQTLQEVKTAIGSFLAKILDRASITRAMFDTDAFHTLCESTIKNGIPEATVERGLRWWREQYKGSEPAYSEYDAIAAAWLGVQTMLVTSSDKPLVGGSINRLTHAVVDEAQDLSPAHLALIAKVLHTKGSLTVLGDVRQNLNTTGGIRSWDELGLLVDRRAFEINYRQSFELGRFVHGLYRHMYRDKPVWTPSERWHGPLPRVARTETWLKVAAVCASECRRAKELVPGCTIAVLYDKKLPAKQLEELRDTLDELLADLLPNVQLVDPRSRGAQLRDTDAIVIASVQQTKGLEFDAVIFVDPQAQWSGEMSELPLRLRNGLYVGASRSRQYLSVLLGVLPTGISQLADEGTCEVLDTTEYTTKSTI